jgi:hypothetical protein
VACAIRADEYYICYDTIPSPCIDNGQENKITRMDDVRSSWSEFTSFPVFSTSVTLSDIQQSSELLFDHLQFTLRIFLIGLPSAFPSRKKKVIRVVCELGIAYIGWLRRTDGRGAPKSILYYYIQYGHPYTRWLYHTCLELVEDNVICTARIQLSSKSTDCGKVMDHSAPAPHLSATFSSTANGPLEETWK